MTKRIQDVCSGTPMTVVAGVCLAVSLGLMLSGTAIAFDPAWVTVVVCGIPLFYLAVTRLVYQRWISSALLICIAMAAAVAIGELFAAGEVAFIMAVGAILEDMTVARAKKGIGALVRLQPRTARRVAAADDPGGGEAVDIADIRAGDCLRVLPGETVPVDGEILSGCTSLDQSVITGESLPVDRAVGDTVFCGTLNRFGSIDILATKVGEDSSLRRLVRLLEEAQERQAPMQRIADRWATRLVPVALLIAAATLLLTGEIVRAVTVLVVFCPCALALATPTAVVAAIGQAAKHGILIKSGEALEKMAAVDCVAFDKTGTITRGDLAVSGLHPADGGTEAGLLALTASAELRSEHPLAQAVVARARQEGLDLQAPEEFAMEPGRGVRAAWGGRSVLCGSEAYLQAMGVPLPDAAEDALRALRAQGKAVIAVAAGDRYAGAVSLSDTLRTTAGTLVENLRGAGARVLLLTGDTPEAAAYMADRAGIEAVRAGLLPADKVEAIRALQGEGHRVAMVGDGVNDAPALGTADVGIAMGSMGSDIAIEAADIALLGDEIEKLPYLTRLARKTVRTIQRGIALSMCINAVAVTLSVLGVLGPVSGAVVHNAGSVLVVLSAALLYDRKM